MSLLSPVGLACFLFLHMHCIGVWHLYISGIDSYTREKDGRTEWPSQVRGCLYPFYVSSFVSV